MSERSDNQKLVEALNLIREARSIVFGIPTAYDLDSLLGVALSEAQRLVRKAPEHSKVPLILSGDNEQPARRALPK